MEMNGVEARDLPRQRTPHRRRPVQTAQQAARKVRDLDAFEFDRALQRHGAVLCAIDIRREDVNIVSPCGQGTTESVDRTDRTAVSKCGQIRWYDVKKAQRLVHCQDGCR
jgi:hypothetical protein